jgi:glycosyltransferase involved in cell wall biosynthesis
MAQSLGIADAVDFLGYVDDPADVELPRLYAAADVFVLPSLREGFGFVLLEAMASGLPIVASNASAIPEVVGDAGILVPAQDAGALAKALARLIADPEGREEIGRRGRQRVEERYTWDKTVDRVLSVYEEAIDLAAKR